MAYLTQYSNSVPVIKYHIEQSLMTIGQHIEMDICIPEDGMAEDHAAVEAVKNGQSYRFIIKSTKEDSPLELNGETVSYAEMQNNDWLVIGGVEFQFTDDGINLIKDKTEIASSPARIKEKPTLVVTESIAKKQNNDSEALKLIKDLKQDLQDASKPLTTKEFIANSRQSRRRLAF